MTAQELLAMRPTDGESAGQASSQSGYPLTASNSNSYQPVCANAGPCPSFSNPAIGYGPFSGDYNADGVNNDYPNAVSYSQSTNNGSWLSGATPKSDFAGSYVRLRGE